MLVDASECQADDVCRQIFKEPWQKDRKYELVERQTNTPAEQASNIKLPAKKRIFELSNRMATHYKSFASTNCRSNIERVVRLHDGSLYGTVNKQQELPDFPQFRTIIDRSRKRKE